MQQEITPTISGHNNQYYNGYRVNPVYIYGGSKSQNKSIFYYKVLFINIHVTLPIATIKGMWSYVAFELLSQPLKMHCTYILYCNAPNLHIHVAYFILFHMHMSTDTFTRL